MTNAIRTVNGQHEGWGGFDARRTSDLFAWNARNTFAVVARMWMKYLITVIRSSPTKIIYIHSATCWTIIHSVLWFTQQLCLTEILHNSGRLIILKTESMMYVAKEHHYRSNYACHIQKKKRCPANKRIFFHFPRPTADDRTGHQLPAAKHVRSTELPRTKPNGPKYVYIAALLLSMSICALVRDDR